MVGHLGGDMLSFLVYDTEEEVEIWATKVVECFETFEMKGNVSKLEIMLIAWGKGSKTHLKKGGSRKTEVQRSRYLNQSSHISQVSGYED